MSQKNVKKAKKIADPTDGFAGGMEIKCVFCSKPWTGKMLEVYARTSAGCDTCGYGSETYGTVSIHCDHCKRLVYRKDFKD